MKASSKGLLHKAFSDISKNTKNVVNVKLYRPALKTAANRDDFYYYHK